MERALWLSELPQGLGKIGETAVPELCPIALLDRSLDPVRVGHDLEALRGVGDEPAAAILRIRHPLDDARVDELVDELLHRLLAQAHSPHQRLLPDSARTDMGKHVRPRLPEP